MIWLEWLPWPLVGLLVGILIGGIRHSRRQADVILVLRQKVAMERTSHYLTYRRQATLERKLGALLKDAEGMAEIAQGSAQLAQLYDAMLADQRAAPFADSTPAPLG